MRGIHERDRAAAIGPLIGIRSAAVVAAFCAAIGTCRADEARQSAPTPNAPQIAAPTGPYTFTNPGAITINDNSTATPYPSTISVAGVPGFIVDVQVRLNGLTHSFPDDLDLLLVDPAGHKLVLMSDSGGSVPASGLTLTLDDHAATGVPNTIGLSSGRYRPRDYNGGALDVFPVPAPSAPYGEPWPTGTDTLYSTFLAYGANGTWSLYIVDGASGDSGSISGGWSLILTQMMLFGGGAITINDAAPATPYPSTVTVSGLPHKVQDIKLAIGNFSHTCPGDVDMLLVAPGGQRFVPFSDTGGCTPGASGVFFLLDDRAGNAVPNTPGSLGTATRYLPTNIGTVDAFAAPAPAGPYPSAQPDGTDSFRSAFEGIDPNGTWSLYVVDDLAADSGSMAGWTLAITTHAEFSNFNGVTLNDVSPAVPYPVTINVSDVPGTLEGAYLRVNGLTHTFPADIDLMLADPRGRGFIAQSDAGFNVDVNQITYTLDDAGAAPMPDTTGLIDGAVYIPTNYSPPDSLPLPAPQSGVASPQPTGTATFGSVYLGGDPNGTWTVYLVDDSIGDSGSILNGITLGVRTIFDFVFVDSFDD